MINAYATLRNDSMPPGYSDFSVFAAEISQQTSDQLGVWINRYVGMINQDWTHSYIGKHPHAAFCIWFKHSKHKTLFDLTWGETLTMIPVRQE